MLAVKSHGHRAWNGAGLETVREHRRPRHRLQQRPVRANGSHQRENDQHFAKPNKHDDTLVKTFTKSNQLFRTVVP